MIFAATCAFAVTPAEAQWRLDAQAGRLQYEAGPDVVSTTVALGLSRSTAVSSLGLFVGVPFSSDEPLWGSLHGFRRLSLSGQGALGIDLSASGFAYRIAARDSTALFPTFEDDAPETGWGAGTEIMPFARWQSPSGGAVAEGRAGVIGFTSDASRSGSFDRAAFAADLSIGAMPAAGLSTRLNGRYVAVKEGSYPFVGAGLAWTRGFTLWGSLGQWLTDATDDLSWEAGASLPLGDRVALALSGRHDPLDPVYATPSRTTWGAGVTVWLSDPEHASPLPVPASYEDGAATIALDGDAVDGAPSIAGDFNQWTPTPMERDGDRWVHRIPLAPGVYNYAFVDEAGNWFVPEGTPGRHADGMGGYVATLVVNEE